MTAYLLQQQLVVIGPHDPGALFAEIAGLLAGSLDRAGQDDLNRRMRLAQPCGERKSAFARRIYGC